MTTFRSLLSSFLGILSIYTCFIPENDKDLTIIITTHDMLTATVTITTMRMGLRRRHHIRLDLASTKQAVTTTLQRLVPQNTNKPPPPPPPPPPPQNEIKYHYESLRRKQVPTFNDNTDPETSHNWLKQIETQLQLLEVPEELKMNVITSFLEDKASKWLETISPTMTSAGPITLPQFREAFLKQYYPAEVRLQKQTPDMTVVDYTSKFNELGTYALTSMVDETMKMHRSKEI